MKRVVGPALIGLPILGLTLVVLGVSLPMPDTWWDPKGFVVNLASGFTAACFGIPLAYLVLQKFVRDEERVNARKEAVDSLNSSIVEILRKSDSLGPFSISAGKAVVVIDQLLKAIERDCTRAVETINSVEVKVLGANKSSWRRMEGALDALSFAPGHLGERELGFPALVSEWKHAATTLLPEARKQNAPIPYAETLLALGKRIDESFSLALRHPIGRDYIDQFKEAIASTLRFHQQSSESEVLYLQIPPEREVSNRTDLSFSEIFEVFFTRSYQDRFQSMYFGHQEIDSLIRELTDAERSLQMLLGLQAAVQLVTRRALTGVP